MAFEYNVARLRDLRLGDIFQWPSLPKDFKMKVILKLDYKTRRALLSCSKSDKRLVEKFRFRKEMEAKIEHVSDDWKCTYCVPRATESNIPPRTYTELFGTHIGAYRHLRKMIKNAKLVTHLSIDLEVNYSIRLREDRQLMPVKKLTLKFDGGYDNTTNNSFEFLIRQLNQSDLKDVTVRMADLRHDQYSLTEKIFTLEKTVLNLETLELFFNINDQQLLGLRAKTVLLAKAGDLTPGGFLQFFQKVVVQKIPNKCYSFQDFSPDMEMFLFDRLAENNRYNLYLNMVDADLKLLIIIFARHDAANNTRHSFIFMQTLRQTSNLDAIRESNKRTLGAYPALRRFFSAVSETLPTGFSLVDLGEQ